MRWEDLFADLERQWEALADGDRQAEIAERTRAEYARVTLLDRLRGSEGRQIHVVTCGGHEVSGELSRVGADFALVATGRQECVLPLTALVAVRGLGGAAVSDQAAGPVRSRLGLGSVLRRVAADRSRVTLLVSDGRTVSGTLQRVGADFVELAAHAGGEPAGPPPRQLSLVPFAAIAMLRRESPVSGP